MFTLLAKEQIQQCHRVAICRRANKPNTVKCSLSFAARVPTVPPQVDGLSSSRETDRIDGTKISREREREMLPIDLMKSAQIGAADSRLRQRMDPPLGSDLHYDDK